MKPPKEYRTVKQPKDTSICGACLVAIITGYDLEHVQACMQTTTSDGHVYYKEKEIIRYLAVQGIYAGMRAIPLENPLYPDQDIEFKWTLKDHPAILAVKSKVYDDGDHWVFWDGQHVRDSSWANQNDTNKLEDYHILEVIPILYSDDYDLSPPPGGKLHQEDCPCMACTTIREHNDQKT